MTTETDWVLAQTLERKRRELEAEELDFAERLANARRREEALKKAARARARKKLVSCSRSLYSLVFTIHLSGRLNLKGS